MYKSSRRYTSVALMFFTLSILSPTQAISADLACINRCQAQLIVCRQNARTPNAVELCHIKFEQCLETSCGISN